LKTDDDVFVDTIHLPTYLHVHGFVKKSKTENFILCFAVENAVPGENLFFDNGYKTSKKEIKNYTNPQIKSVILLHVSLPTNCCCENTFKFTLTNCMIIIILIGSFVSQFETKTVLAENGF
jgi:hypothetical protein